MSEHTVAVIGAGVSGLTAAYILQSDREVTLFECSGRLGGHAETHVLKRDFGDLPLDLAFMVFNERNYPSLSRLFRELGVRSQVSEMSMSMFCEECGLSFLCGSPLRGLPVRAPGVAVSRWMTVVQDARRLATRAESLASGEPGALTLQDLLDQEGCSDYSAEHVLLPLVSAVWSCDASTARLYPAGYLFRFLANHGLLPSSKSVRWRTVAGGSRTYVEAVAERLTTVLHTTPVRALRRTAAGVELRDAADNVHHFDAAVVATHPDQALALLQEPTRREREVLGAIPYSRNEAVLHTDTAWLPPDRAHWASWNHRRRRCHDNGRPVPVVMSYHLNRLQRLDGPTDYLLTLNPSTPIADEVVLARMTYEHPLYTPGSVAATQSAAALSDEVIAFAGAYQGWGFHEDGCLSGAQAAQALGVTW